MEERTLEDHIESLSPRLQLFQTRRLTLREGSKVLGYQLSVMNGFENIGQNQTKIVFTSGIRRKGAQISEPIFSWIRLIFLKGLLKRKR